MDKSLGRFVECHDMAELSRKAASVVVELGRDAIEKRGVFNIALSGGSTPRHLYTLLAKREFRQQLGWSRVHLFWGDERCVGPDNRESNYRMVSEALSSRVDIPEQNIHRIKGELKEKAADEYEAELKEHFALDTGGLPKFDLMLLGMGHDGHFASIFPGSPAVNETERLAVYVEVKGAAVPYRVTVGHRVITNSRNIIFLISGHEKKEALEKARKHAFEPLKFPVQLLGNSRAKLMWFTDFAVKL